MPDHYGDQAAGLRRMFGGRHLRVVTFLSATAGVGKTQAVVNLAVSLAAQGRKVLVVDELDGADCVAASFGHRRNADMLDVISGRCSLDAALLEIHEGVRVLSAARAVGSLDQLSNPQREALFAAVGALGDPPDVVLVDARHDHPLGFSPFALATPETVIALAAQPSSITSAYSLIKQVSQRYGRRSFRILINRARSTGDAEQIYNNLAKVAGSRGLATLDLAAVVPNDDSLRAAASLGRPFVTAFPESAAAAAIRHLAAELLHWPCEDDPEGFEQLMRQLLHLSQRITPRAAQARQ